MSRLTDYLEAARLQNAPLLSALRRGTGQVVGEHPQGVLLRETDSGVYFLTADTAEAAEALLTGREDIPALVLCQSRLTPVAERLCGLRSTGACRQVVYEGKPLPRDPRLAFRTPEAPQLDRIDATYALADRRELETLAAREMLFCGWDGAEFVGYVGRHRDGSAGLLNVFPEYRRRGYGTGLAGFVVNRILAAGDIPYGHIFVENTASLEMQRQLGWSFAPREICWLFPKGEKLSQK